MTEQVGRDWRPEEEVVEAFEDLVGGYRENVECKAFEFWGRGEKGRAI